MANTVLSRHELLALRPLPVVRHVDGGVPHKLCLASLLPQVEHEIDLMNEVRTQMCQHAETQTEKNEELMTKNEVEQMLEDLQENMRITMVSKVRPLVERIRDLEAQSCTDSLPSEGVKGACSPPADADGEPSAPTLALLPAPTPARTSTPTPAPTRCYICGELSLHVIEDHGLCDACFIAGPEAESAELDAWPLFLDVIDLCNLERCSHAACQAAQGMKEDVEKFSSASSEQCSGSFRP